MYVSTIYDTGNPELLDKSILMLSLDREVKFFLPTGKEALGILREVNFFEEEETNLVELVIETSDEHEWAYQNTWLN